MEWFAGLKTVEEIKKRYRGLAMQHHPDRGGETRVMQEINAQYHQALLACDGMESVGTDGKTHRYTYNRDTEQAIMDKIRDLLRHPMPGVEVWLIGSWVWVQGDTKPFKEILKAEGCWWHSKRGCWYWKPYRTRSRYSGVSLEWLAAKYGAKVFEGGGHPEGEDEGRVGLSG